VIYWSLLLVFYSGVPKNSSPYYYLIFWMGSYMVLMLLVNYSTNPDLQIIFNLNYSSIFFLKPTEFINLFSTSFILSASLPTFMVALFLRVWRILGSIKNFYFFFMLFNNWIVWLMISHVSFVEIICIFWRMAVQFRMKLVKKLISNSLNRYSLKRLLKNTRMR
jgi:hypothetical protein